MKENVAPKKSGKSRTATRCQPIRSRMMIARDDQEREKDHQQMREVVGQVEERLDLDLPGLAAAENRRKELPPGLDRALRPADAAGT